MTATRYAGDWQTAGACLSADPDIFYPVSGSGASLAQINEARRICGRCSVRRECLDFAIQTGEAHGIWGGTTPEDRTRARRQEMARRRQPAGGAWRRTAQAQAS